MRLVDDEQQHVLPANEVGIERVQRHLRRHEHRTVLPQDLVPLLGRPAVCGCGGRGLLFKYKGATRDESADRRGLTDVQPLVVVVQPQAGGIGLPGQGQHGDGALPPRV